LNIKLGKFLRLLAIVFLGLTGVVNLLGGAGTTCAAFLTENFPSMAAIMNYRWLYQALVILTIPLGVAGMWATVRLARSKSNAYRIAVILLVAGVILGAVHYYASMALRGKAAPANMKLYTNMLSLLIFLLLRLPGIRKSVDFSKPGDKRDISIAGGLSAIIAGCVTLTTFYWAAPSHTYQGDNWVCMYCKPRSPWAGQG